MAVVLLMAALPVAVEIKVELDAFVELATAVDDVEDAAAEEEEEDPAGAASAVSQPVIETDSTSM